MVDDEIEYRTDFGIVNIDRRKGEGGTRTPAGKEVQKKN